MLFSLHITSHINCNARKCAKTRRLHYEAALMICFKITLSQVLRWLLLKPDCFLIEADLLSKFLYACVPKDTTLHLPRGFSNVDVGYRLAME